MAEIIPVEPDKVMLDWEITHFLSPLFRRFFSMFNLLSATWYPFDFSTPFNAVRAVFIWLTLALVITLAALIAVKKGESRKKYVRLSAVVGVCYLTLVAVTLLTLTFVLNETGAFIALLLVPLIALILSLAFLALTFLLNGKKAIKLTGFSLVLLSFTATLICMGVRFENGNGAEMNGITNKDVNSFALYLSAILFTALVIFTGFIFDKSKSEFDTRSITYAGVCVAMSFALSYLRIVKMPQGGSITIASLLPLMLYSFMFGTKKGLLTGAVYGLLQAVQDPFIIHPAQFILDYPLAFSSIGLAGIFARNENLKNLPVLKFVLGGIIAGIARFIMHLMSGIFAFSAFAGEQNPVIYSLVYQAGYVLPDIAIAIITGAAIFSSKSFCKFVSEVSLAESK